MLVTVDEIGRTPEQIAEGVELHGDFGADHFGIEPAQLARAQKFLEGQEKLVPERTEMHGQGAERRGQRDVQADRGAGVVRGSLLQARGLVAADCRRDHHHRGRIEAAALDQFANGAVDAGADAVIVGAEPDPPRRRVVHSAAVRLAASSAESASQCFSLCSATK